MKPKKVVTMHWFQHHNRRHVAFLLAVGLISVLFIVSLVGVLSGRYKPFADVGPGPQQKLNHKVVLSEGKLAYGLPDGSTQTNTSNSVNVTAKALTKFNLAFLGVGDAITRIPKLEGVMTVVPFGGNIERSAVARRIVWSTQTTEPIEGGIAKIVVDSEELRSGVDTKPPATVFSVIVKEQNSLAVKVDGVTNLRTISKVTVPRGDFNNDNQINGGDVAHLVVDLGKSVGPDNPHDLNGDGEVGGGDIAVLAAHLYESGATY